MISDRSLKSFFLFLFLTPLLAFATCSEADSVRLIEENLTPRIQFVKQEKLWRTYRTATEKQEPLLKQAYEKKDWESVCTGLLKYIDIADDVLAGGDGLSEVLKKPWKQCTPENVSELDKKFRSMCLTQFNERCKNEKLKPYIRKLTTLLETQKGPEALKPADYVDQLCMTLATMTEMVKE